MKNVFLLNIAILGLIAFFEPCTIATHTLFAVHTKQKNKIIKELSILITTRISLIIILLVVINILFNAPNWEIIKPEILFIVLAAIYLVSRYSYIPIPHLDFSELLPSKFKNNNALRLGFTMPACTIPLFIVIVGLTLTIDNIMFTIIAGLVYGVMFSLPTVISVYKGVSTNAATILEYAAKTTPFITAGLFLLAAFVLIIN